MKVSLVLTGLTVCLVFPLRAQNIVNKLGTGGVFSIKDATKDFFTLSQSNGRVGIGTTNPSHLFQVARLINFDSLTTTTALGYRSLYSNTTGDNNTAIGPYVLFSNTTGVFNTAAGRSALFANTTGSLNVAFGAGSLIENISGESNTAVGLDALRLNTGSYNTGVGTQALYSTMASQNNVGIGSNAGDSFHNGYNNVFLGANTDVNQPDLFNVVAVGEGTIVTASSTARFGNSSTGSYGGWANWTNVSDARFKKNLRENVPGLEFILKLRPVTYNFDATGMEEFLHKNDAHGRQATPDSAGKKIREKALLDKERITQTGFVAQEVETAARELGYDFSGVDKPKNENDYYGLRYAEFVVPLVKAVQELKAENTEVKARLAILERLQERLVAQLARLQGEATAAASLAGN
jgi:hypothetical protein